MPTFENGNDPQALVGAGVVVFVVGLLGLLGVMKRPWNARCYVRRRSVGIAMGAANVDVFGSRLAWGILMGLATVFSYFGERELGPRPARATASGDHARYCTTCGIN